MSGLSLEKSGWQKSAINFASAIAAAVTIKAFLLFVVIPYLTNTLPSGYEADKFPDQYDLIAMNLLDGNGYKIYADTSETMLRTPGFVLILAGIFSVFGHNLAATKAFNVLFSCATASLAYLLGRKVTKSHRLGLIAATVTLLHPAIMIADSRAGVESVILLAIMAFMLLFYRALETGALKNYLAAGLAFGVVLLIKPSAGLFPAFLFLYLLGMKPNFERLRCAAVSVGALVLVAGTVLSPWIVRNYAISGRFVPTATLGGLAFFQGTYIVTHFATGREHHILLNEAAAEQGVIAQQMGLKFKPGFFPLFYSISDEIKYYDHLGDIVKSRFVEQPSLLLDVIGFNSIGFWVQGRTAKATALNTILVLPFLVLAIWGAYAGWRQSLMVGPILLFIGAFYVPHLPTIGMARYHVPLIPLLAILACIPLRYVIGDVTGPLRKERDQPHS